MSSGRQFGHRRRPMVGGEPLEARQLLAGDLVGHWLADTSVTASNNVATAWSDVVSGRAATAIGAPVVQPNSLGGRATVSFDPANNADGFRLPAANNPLARADDFSVAVAFVTDSQALQGTNGAWFKNTGLVDSTALGFATDWGVSINSTGQIATGMSRGFGLPIDTLYSTASGLNDGALHVAVVTRDGGQMSIYVDDQPVTTASGFSEAARSPRDVTWGIMQDASGPFTGRIGQVRLYNGALSPAEVAALVSEVRTYYSNGAPISLDDAYVLNEDQFFAVSVPQGVLSNDSDPDGDPLQAVVVSPPQHGKVVLNANGSFIYTPDVNYFGPDSFAYTANDFRPGNVATASFDVRPVYDLPRAVADQYKTVPQGTLQVAAAAGVLANDVNIDQVPVTAVLEQTVANGSLTLRADGSFDYSPNGFAGTTQFTYRITDGTTPSAPVAVTLVVNSAPLANNDFYFVDEDSVLSASSVLLNDVDAEGNALTLTVLSQPTHGTLLMQPDGQFSYTPVLDYFGPDEFTYSLSDGIDASNVATVQLMVPAVNDRPSGASDAYIVSGASLTVDATNGVLANDDDVDSAISAALLSLPAKGSVTLNADGSFVYYPAPGAAGEDRFTYQATDGELATDPITVTLIAQVTDTQIADPTGDAVVTFNELMYNPPGNQAREEWVELKNQMGINMDISGWRITGGIYFEFPEGTIIPSNGYLLLAGDPVALAAEQGVTGALGPFSGRLSNGGEELVLRNNADRVLDIMEYGDGGDWPVGPDGSGATLAKRYVHSVSLDPSNWTTSAQVGGSPGTDNFPPFDATPIDVPLANWGGALSYQDSGADLGVAWREVGYDNAAWPTAAGIFQAGDPQFPPQNVGGLAEPGVGLYGYWPLDAATGTTAENRVEGGAAGSLQRGPVWTIDAERGAVLRFDGTNDYVAAGNLPAIGVNDDFTWSFWYKQSAAPNASGVIVGNRSGGTQDPLQFVKFTPSKFEYYHAGGDPFLDYTIPNGQWTHLAVVKSGEVLTYYVNGQSVGSLPTVHDMAANPLFFGGDPNAAGEFVSGALDDVAVWTRDLPADAIAGLAAGTYNPLTAPTTFVPGPTIPEGLPEQRVDLAAAASTYYFRHEFTFNDDPQRTELWLDRLVDDGAVFYLNGQEVARYNLPAGPISAGTPADSEILEIGATGRQRVAADALRRGDNVLAIELHKSGAAVNDALLAFELVASVTPAPPNENHPLINEISAGAAADFRVELFNPGTTPIELGGYRLADAVLPAVTLAAGQYHSFDRTVLGTSDTAEGDEIFLVTPNQRRVVDAQRVTDRLIGRDPALGGRWFFPTIATFDGVNQFDVESDIVINEIMYHAPGFYSQQLDKVFENNEQWVELYNRSSNRTIDLSGWSFGDGIDFVFPAGTSLAPGGYLVIAQDPATLRANRPELAGAQILGPFSGQLSNGGENLQLLDVHGNLADEVHYYDGGRWDGMADGQAASLELRNPYSDNGTAEAWQGSDETDQVAWQTITLRGNGRSWSASDPTQYNELLLGMLNDGQVLIDDVVVIENPDTPDAKSLIQNGTFDGDAIGAAPATWRIIGTQHGWVTVDPADPTNHVLLLDARGPTEHMHNNAGTTLKSGDQFVRLSNSATYEVSFRARWVSGSNQLNSRLYFNRLGHTTRLDRPTNVGSPGQINSRYAPNVGPTYEGLIHSPAVPDADQPVTVSVRATDHEGIASLSLFYSTGGEFVSVPMSLESDGIYRGQIPGQAAATLVQFYVQGQDPAGGTSMFPADGPLSRALYRVQDGLAADDVRHTLRILMTPDDAREMHTNVNVMSNDRRGATVIYRENEIFYDVGVRLKGSQRGRDQVVRVGFNIEFPPDHLFRGVHETIGVDRSGSGNEYSQEEIIIRQIVNHAGDMPQLYDDLIHVIAPDSRHTGSAMLAMARYNDVFLDSQYENGSDGTAFEYELIYFPLTTIGGVEGLKRPEPDDVRGVNMADQGDDVEAYRWHWLIKNNREENDYSRMMQMLKQIGKRATDAGFHADLSQMIDVDQWLRSFAVQILTGVGDNYASGAQHNGMFYVRPADNRVLFLPWDMDFSFTQGPNTPLITNTEQRKLMENEAYERLYYGHVIDIVNTTFNSEYINEWIDHFDALVPGQPFFSTFKPYISTRSTFARSQVERAIPIVPFEIATPTGIDVGAAAEVTLEGTGWVDVRTMRLADSEIPLNVNWPANNRWQVTVPVAVGTQDLVLEAYDFQGKLIGTDTVSVTSAGTSPLARSLRVTEINYHPGAPRSTDLWVDEDEYEFVEVINVGPDPINLAGVRLLQVQREGELEGVRFTFADQTLVPGATLVVARNRAAMVSRYGATLPMATGVGDAARLDAFSGQLDNGGEVLTLVDPNGAIIQQFGYDDGWYPTTDGVGYTLEFVDPTQTDLNAWNSASRWRASQVLYGTPGGQRQLPGDSDRNGVFDTGDLVLALQAGEYEDGISGNSTWEEGDWDGDGDFTTQDLVLAFTQSVFRYPPPAEGARPAHVSSPFATAPDAKLVAAAVDAVHGWGDADDDSDEDRFQV